MFDTAKRTLSGLLTEGENVAMYVLEGEYVCRYCIESDFSNDIGGALEETLHRLLQYDFSPEEIYEITGMSQEEGTISIDLGYSMPSLLSYTPNIISYADAVKERKVYLIRNYLPGNNTSAITYALNEELAIKEIQSLTSQQDGWYTEEFTVDDGLRFLDVLKDNLVIHKG